MNPIDLLPLRQARTAGTTSEKVQWLRVPLVIIGAVVFGLICGLLAGQVSPLIALVGLSLLLVALYRPALVILLVIGMTSTVIDPSILPTINMGYKFTPVELSLMVLVGIIVVRYLATPYKSTLVRTPLDLPVLLFFAASTLSFFYAMYVLGADRGYLVPQWRILFCYLSFFAVTNFVRTRRQFTFFTSALLVLAVISAILVAFQAAFGSSLHILPSANMGVANVFDQEYSNVPRVIVPGTSLIFMMLIPALILYSIPSFRKGLRGPALLAVIILLLAAIAISFSRTWWIGMGIALAGLFLLISTGQKKLLLGRIGIPIVFVLLMIPLLGSYIPQAENIVQVLGLRAGSLFAGEQTIQDSSTQWRIREIDSALVKIQENPILGVGPGGELREQWWSTDVLTRFMHNSYLYVLADLGILGFLPFLWFSILFLYRGFRFGRKLQDPALRSWVLGLSLSFVALLIAGVAGPEFMALHTVPVIGAIFGLTEVALRLERQETTESRVEVGLLASHGARSWMHFRNRERTPRPIRMRPELASHNNQSFSGQFVKQFSYSGTGVVFNMLFSTVNMMILARYLPRTEYGVFVLLMVVADFLSMLSSFGLNTSAPTSISAAAEEDKGVIANSIIIFRLFTYGLVLVVYYIFQRWFLLLLGGTEAAGLATFIPFMLATAGYRTLFRSILQGYLKFKRMAIIDFTTSALNCLMIVIFIWLLGASFAGLVIAQLVSQGFACIAFFVAIPGPRRLQFSRSHLVKIIRFGWPLQVNDMLTFVFKNTGGISVAAFLGPADVALLNIAGKLPGNVRSVFESFRTVYLPNLSKLIADGDQRRAHELLNTSLRLVSFVTAVGAIVAVIFSKEIILILFSSKYLASAPLLVMSMVALNINLVGNVLGTSLVAAKYSKGPAIANVVTTVTSIASNVSLIPTLGVIGASMSSAAAGLASNPVNVWLLRRQKIYADWWIYVKPLAILLVSVAIGFALQSFRWYYRLPLLPAFLLTSYLLGVFSQKDVRILAGLVAGRLSGRPRPRVANVVEEVANQ